MKIYTVMLLQLMIWSGYTLLEWLSKHDEFIYNLLMFFIFLYLAITAGDRIIQSTKTTVWVTCVSLTLYSLLHWSFLYFH